MIFSLRSTQQRCFSLQRRVRRSHRINEGRARVLESGATHFFSRLSRFWLVTGGIAPTEREDGHAKLARAGFLRQSHAGIFHMLPLGVRVQEKLEALIDKYMSQLGASKVSLSSISSQALWKETNRLDGYGQELFKFTDRKDGPYILAPTHEEEITKLVGNTVRSYKSLPLRLYQIGRKYRDEIRPRHGVLRAREFVMKDLYTFDHSLQSALKTYEEARVAYNKLFDELKLPYLVAEASSGDIGGDLSHEYHLPSRIGEDNVISCTDCNYVANEELATARLVPHQSEASVEGIGVDTDSSAAQVWRGISKDRKTLVNVWYPAPFVDADINPYALKSILPGLDSSVKTTLPLWESTLSSSSSSTSTERPQLLSIIDYRLGQKFVDGLINEPNQFPILSDDSLVELSQLDHQYITSSTNGEPINTIRIRSGDHCPRCTSGTLKIQTAVELGHTFHLGTKYSEALDARVQLPSNLVEDGQADTTKSNSMTSVPMQMGCHGIGVSRIIGAVAEHLADNRGLNWPRAIAPFEVVVIPGTSTEEDIDIITHTLTRSSPTYPPIDLVLDDRVGASLSWKMNDADLVGYPVIVIIGRRWKTERLCEVQCRRVGSPQLIPLIHLRGHVDSLLSKL